MPEVKELSADHRARLEAICAKHGGELVTTRREGRKVTLLLSSEGKSDVGVCAGAVGFGGMLFHAFYVMSTHRNSM